MYSNIKSIQILISLLKQNDIRDIVLSPGGSDIPLIHSVETDDFFTCYSVVDERSAAYFALGISQQKQRIVACVCTSGTAVCNYLPGITEAWYQNAPVLAITCDKNPYYQGQLETQKIEQTHVFDGVVKKSVSLPAIKSADDEWLCNRLVNEAIVALSHHGSGPSHINIPIVQNYEVYDCETLPVERKISIVPYRDFDPEQVHSDLLKYKRIMVVVGQNLCFTKEDVNNMSYFFQTYNCFFSIEKLSNVHFEGCVETYPLSETHLPGDIVPDLVISIGNNLAAYGLKPFLRRHFGSIDNWLISEAGEIRDAYKSLKTVYEITPSCFFAQLAALNRPGGNDRSYYAAWKKLRQEFRYPDFGFSNFYVARALSQIIGEDSILHTAILNSTRVMQFFDLPDSVRVYSNVGALGIDGCMSTFAGQAAATDKLAYLLIGDLSFFYDMNAAGLRSISKNVRIIMINNGGGGEFHFFVGKDRIPTINDYISAGNDRIAAGWIASLGYDYYSAENKEEFDEIIRKFNQESDKPMFLEVFTDIEYEAKSTRRFYNSNKDAAGNPLVNAISRKMTSKQREQIKKVLAFVKGFKR